MFNLLLGIAIAIWLAGMAASLYAIRLGRGRSPRRFGTAIALSLGAVLLGYLGLTRLSISASKTVNDETVWSFNSRWFHIALIAFAAFALIHTLWVCRTRAQPVVS